MRKDLSFDPVKAEVHTKTVTLKTRPGGWIVDKTTDFNGYGKLGVWYELINPDDPQTIVDAFRSYKAACKWAKDNSVYALRLEKKYEMLEGLKINGFRNS